MKINCIVALFLAVFLLFGCADRQPYSASVTANMSASESENLDSEVVSPKAELKVPQTLYIYRFYDEGKIYEKEEVTFSGEQNLLTVINAITKTYGLDESLPILKITQQKGFVVIDFDTVLLDRFNKADLYSLLTSLVMSLQQNVLTVETVQFQLASEVGVFGETFEPSPLAFVEGDPTEFAAICEAIPYEGLQTALPYDPAGLIKPIDATEEEITKFLSALGQIEKDASSPAELDQERLTMHCIWATGYYWSEPYEPEPKRYLKELAPIADSVSVKLGMREDMFWIVKHVQQTAKLLCGDDFSFQLTDENCSPWKYFKQEGVITPPHMSGGYDVLPIVLNYQSIDDGYRVEAVYIYAGEGGYSLWAGDAIPENKLEDVIYNQAPRREIVLKRADDGGLRFVSHRFL